MKAPRYLGVPLRPWTVIELTTDIGRSKTKKIESTTSVSSAVEIFSRKSRHFQGALTAFKLGSRALDQFAELIRLWSQSLLPQDSGTDNDIPRYVREGLASISLRGLRHQSDDTRLQNNTNIDEI